MADNAEQRFLRTAVRLQALTKAAAKDIYSEYRKVPVEDGVSFGDFCLESGHLSPIDATRIRATLIERGYCPDCGSEEVTASGSTACSSCGAHLVTPDARTLLYSDRPGPRGSVDPHADTLLNSAVREYVQDQYGFDPKVELRASSTGAATIPAGTSQRYEISNEIARGGMGAILSAVDTEIQRDVAIKVMLESENAPPEKVARFIREAQIQGQLEHPNICPVHEIGVDGKGRLYFTMKKVKGLSLQEVLAERARKPETTEWTLSRLLDVFAKVCDAISFAHNRGVIHRDLKPANVMIGEFGEVQVMDWGLAKVVGGRDIPLDGEPESAVVDESGQTVHGTVVGTPAYMAPEQAAGEVSAMDERTDVYALGGLLYSILTGRAPAKGRDMKEILKVVRSNRITPPSERAKDATVPSDLEAACMKALAGSPSDRYQDAVALKADVIAFLEGRALSAAEYSLLEIAGMWVRRNRAIAISAVAVFAISLSLFFYLRWDAKKEIPGLIERAAVAQGQGDFETALELYNQVLGMDPQNPDARTGITAASSGRALAREEERRQIAAEEEETRRLQAERRAIEEAATLWKQVEMSELRLGVLEGDREGLLFFRSGEPNQLEIDRWYGEYGETLRYLDKLAALAGRVYSEKGRQQIKPDRVVESRKRVSRSASDTAVILEHWNLAAVWIDRAGDAWDAAERKSLRDDLAHQQRRAVQLVLEEARTLLKEAGEFATLDRGWFDQSVAHLVRIASPDLVKLLLDPEYLDSETGMISQLTIEALGKIGDRTTIGPEGADAVIALSLRLQESDVKRQFERAVALASALGFLGDSRAHPVLYNKRTSAPPDSIFRQRTDTAFQRIPKVEIPLEGNGNLQQLHLIGDISTESGDYEEARAAYDRALKIDPDFVDALSGRGTLNSVEGRWEEALTDYTRAIELSDDDTFFLLDRTNVYRSMGRYDDALRDVNAALQLRPRLARALVLRAGVYLDGYQNYEAAEKDAVTVTRLSPDQAGADYILALIDYDQGRVVDAEKHCTDGLAKHPEFKQAAHLRGLCRSEQSRFQEAIEDFQLALQVDPRYLDAYHSLASAFWETSQFERALKCTDTALEIRNDSALTWKIRARAFANLQRFKEALEAYDTAIRLDPVDPVVRMDRGRLHSVLGNEKEAAADFSFVLQNDPSAPMRDQMEAYVKEHGE